MNLIITGVSRGIGLELCRQTLARGDRVLGVTRTQTEELQALFGKSAGKFELLKLDLTETGAEEKIAEAARPWPAVDALIGNAGVYLGDELDGLMKSFRTNAVAPHLVARALFPALRKSKNPKVLQITSLMGSIEDNTSGGSYAYRASKAALNQLTRTLAKSEPWLSSAVIHPGWVQTDMGGAGAPTPVAESARGILAVLERLGPKESGKFFDFEGEILPLVTQSGLLLNRERRPADQPEPPRERPEDHHRER